MKVVGSHLEEEVYRENMVATVPEIRTEDYHPKRESNSSFVAVSCWHN